MNKSSQGHGQGMMKAGGVVAIIFGFVLVAGCESARDPQLLDNPNYMSGYSDGCRTSHERVAGFDDTITRNRLLAETEPAYQIGWRDGYHGCGGMSQEASTASDREIFLNGSEHYGSVPR